MEGTKRMPPAMTGGVPDPRDINNKLWEQQDLDLEDWNHVALKHLERGYAAMDNISAVPTQPTLANDALGVAGRLATAPAPSAVTAEQLRRVYGDSLPLDLPAADLLSTADLTQAAPWRQLGGSNAPTAPPFQHVPAAQPFQHAPGTLTVHGAASAAAIVADVAPTKVDADDPLERLKGFLSQNNPGQFDLLSSNAKEGVPERFKLASQQPPPGPPMALAPIEDYGMPKAASTTLGALSALSGQPNGLGVPTYEPLARPALPPAPQNQMLPPNPAPNPLQQLSGAALAPRVASEGQGAAVSLNRNREFTFNPEKPKSSLSAYEEMCKAHAGRPSKAAAPEPPTTAPNAMPATTPGTLFLADAASSPVAANGPAAAALPAAPSTAKKAFTASEYAKLTKQLAESCGDAIAAPMLPPPPAHKLATWAVTEELSEADAHVSMQRAALARETLDDIATEMSQDPKYLAAAGKTTSNLTEVMHQLSVHHNYDHPPPLPVVPWGPLVASEPVNPLVQELRSKYKPTVRQVLAGARAAPPLEPAPGDLNAVPTDSCRAMGLEELKSEMEILGAVEASAISGHTAVAKRKEPPHTLNVWRGEAGEAARTRVEQAADLTKDTFHRPDQEMDRQLKIVLQKLSASDATDVEQAATQLAHWTNQQATREMVLAHPAVNGAVVRLQVNLEAFDRFAVAACLAAVRGLALDPIGRKLLLSPKQFLGVRSPESCVESMCKGLSEALVSPDPKMVHDAAKALALLFMSMEALQIMLTIPETSFRALLINLADVMSSESMPEAAGDAAGALNLAAAHGPTRKRLYGEVAGNLEAVLAALTALMTPETLTRYTSEVEAHARTLDRAKQAALVLISLTCDEEGRVKVMTRHPSLSLLMEGITYMLRVDDPSIRWHAATVLANLCCCHELCEWLMLRPHDQLDALMASIFRCCQADEVAVTRTLLAAAKALCVAAPAKVLQLTDDNLKLLFFALEKNVASMDAAIAEAAVLCAGYLMPHRLAERLYYAPGFADGHLPELMSQLTLAVHSPHRSVMQGASGALVRMLRGTHGEDLLKSNLVHWVPEEYDWTGMFVQRAAYPVPFNLLPPQVLQLMSSLLAAATTALRSSDLAVAGELVEVMCVWAGLPEPAWTHFLLLDDNKLLAFVIALVEMLKHRSEEASIRNTVILLNCFTLDERGQGFLSLMDPEHIRMLLVGLRELHQDSGDQAAADLAETTLCNLEDLGPPCWRRWMCAIDLQAPIVTYPQTLEQSWHQDPNSNPQHPDAPDRGMKGVPFAKKASGARDITEAEMVLHTQLRREFPQK